MADFVSKEKRSKIMRAIKSKDSHPELRVRSLLHANGFRFSLHRRELPGRPDICLARYGTVILVNGCFWHHHEGCVHARIPDTNREFWHTKISKTRDRDARTERALADLGWRTITVWECELIDELSLMARLEGELRVGPTIVRPRRMLSSRKRPGPSSRLQA